MKSLPVRQTRMFFRLIGFHLRETLTARTLVFFAAVFLITAFLFFSLPSLTSSSDRASFDLSLSIVDPENSLVSNALANILGDLNGMGQVYRESMETAQARLDNNKILMILQIPEGFFEATQALQKRPPITLWLNPRMPAETAIFVRALRSVAGSLEGIQASYMAFAQAIRPLYPDIESYNGQLQDTFAQVALWALTRRGIMTINETARMNTSYHVISCIVCLLCMQTGLLLMAQAQDERKNGLIYRLALSKAPWWASPLSRQLAGLLWVGVSFAPLIVGLKAVYPQTRLELILPAVFCLYWVISNLCQAAGYLSGGSTLALPGMWLALLVLLLLGGCIYPQTLLPALVKPLMPLSPAYFAYQTVYEAFQGKPLPGDAIAAFFVMASFSMLLMGLAWKKGLHASRTGAQG
jgi:hypothetical protein